MLLSLTYVVTLPFPPSWRHCKPPTSLCQWVSIAPIPSLPWRQQLGVLASTVSGDLPLAAQGQVCALCFQYQLHLAHTMEVSALCRSVLVWSAGRPAVGLIRPLNPSCATEHLCPPLPLFFPVRKGPVSTQQGSLVLIGSGPVLLALHSRDPVRCQRLNLG